MTEYQDLSACSYKIVSKMAEVLAFSEALGGRRGNEQIEA